MIVAYLGIMSLELIMYLKIMVAYRLGITNKPTNTYTMTSSDDTAMTGSINSSPSLDNYVSKEDFLNAKLHSMSLEDRCSYIARWLPDSHDNLLRLYTCMKARRADLVKKEGYKIISSFEEDQLIGSRPDQDRFGYMLDSSNKVKSLDILVSEVRSFVSAYNQRTTMNRSFSSQNGIKKKKSGPRSNNNKNNRNNKKPHMANKTNGSNSGSKGNSPK